MSNSIGRVKTGAATAGYFNLTLFQSDLFKGKHRHELISRYANEVRSDVYLPFMTTTVKT